MDSKTRFAGFLCICFLFALISEPGSASKTKKESGSNSKSSSSSEEEDGSGEDVVVSTEAPKSSTSNDKSTVLVGTTNKVNTVSLTSDHKSTGLTGTTRKLASTSATSDEDDNVVAETTDKLSSTLSTANENETTSSDTKRRLEIISPTPDDESPPTGLKIILWVVLYFCACVMIIFAYHLRHHPCIASIRARRCWGGISTYKKICFESTQSLDVPTNQGIDEDSDSDVHYDLAKQKLEGMGQAQIIDKVRREIDTKEQVYESLGGNIPIAIPGSKPSGVGRGHGCPMAYHKPGAGKKSPVVFQIGETVV